MEILFVREVMRTNVVALPAGASPEELARSVRESRLQGHERRGQHLYPVVDQAGNLTGVLTRHDLAAAVSHADTPSLLGETDSAHPSADLVRSTPVVAYADEPLRVVVYRMAETGLTQFPVVDRADARRLVGLISLRDLLRARERNSAEERERERVIRVRLLPRLRARRETATLV